MHCGGNPMNLAFRDLLVIALGNFYHNDRSLKECFLKLADVVGMAILIVFLGICIFS
jgi:hypothetical protein